MNAKAKLGVQNSRSPVRSSPQLKALGQNKVQKEERKKFLAPKDENRIERVREASRSPIRMPEMLDPSEREVDAHI
jgi:hypothetical protein